LGNNNTSSDQALLPGGQIPASYTSGDNSYPDSSLDDSLNLTQQNAGRQQMIDNQNLVQIEKEGSEISSLERGKSMVSDISRGNKSSYASYSDYN
jgi:hypothetical protein